MPPLGGLSLVGVGHISSADDAHHGIIEHAGGGVDENEDALAAHFEAGQVLAIAFTGEMPYLCAAVFAGGAPAFEPFEGFLLCLEVRLQAVDVFAGGKGIIVIAGQLGLPLGNGFQNPARQTLGFHQLFPDLLQGVARFHQVLFPLEHLLFHTVNFTPEVGGDLIPAGQAPGVHNHKEQQHGAQAAGNAVNEGDAKYGYGSLFHQRPRTRSV
ncbi:MAG: hypothetical protein BWY77_02009 [bacterium ADurb.Bin431]|nr:MAG: hypothetical protein BWY77_02009 [bacterium ADurb.Bin431]